MVEVIKAHSRLKSSDKKATENVARTIFDDDTVRCQYCGCLTTNLAIHWAISCTFVSEEEANPSTLRTK